MKIWKEVTIWKENLHVQIIFVLAESHPVVLLVNQQ